MLFNFKKLLTQFSRKILKNQCFSGYTDMLMTYIKLYVHGHFQELIRETGFYKCYQFHIDATIVGEKIQRINNKQLMASENEKVANRQQKFWFFF